MASFSGLLLVTATLVLLTNAVKLPPGWKTCKISLPPAEYDPCIMNALNVAVNELFTKGAPNLNIPPLSPLKIPAIVIGQGNGPVAVDIKAWDVEFSDLLTWKLGKLRYEQVENYKFGADVTFSKPLVWESKYELNGKVLVLPIRGKGDCRFQIDNPRVSIDLSGVPYTKNGETYMNVTDLIYAFETDRLHLHFDNLFDGNKQLGDNMNLFLNENWVELLKELKPAISESIGLAFKNIAAQIFHSIPYNKLFPE